MSRGERTTQSKARRRIASVALAMAGLLVSCDRPPEAHYQGQGEDGRARPAPRIFASADKGLVLLTPLGSSYCPLPEDWLGADTGTTIYLTQQANCQPTGEGVRPADPAAPSITIAYRQRDPVAQTVTCRAVGGVRVLGQQTVMCETRAPEGVTVWVRGYFRGEGTDNVATFTLKTTPTRLLQDMATFRSLVEGAGVCTRMAGAEVEPCPASAQYF